MGPKSDTLLGPPTTTGQYTGDTMTDWTRRDLLQGGSAAVGAIVLTGTAPASSARRPARIDGDPLVHVAPELRAAARQILDLSARNGPFNDATLPGFRARMGEFASPRLPDVPVERHMVAVGSGQPDVAVYLINARAGTARPAILHTHGGGFILGRAEGEVGYLQQLAKELDCVIASVEYRLAPETRYTGSIEDNYAGLRWLYREAKSFGVDAARIAVLGESAGGGHAALLAITARDRGEVPLIFQSLIYPMLDDRTGSTAHLPGFIGAVGWDAPANRYGWRSFLGMAPGGRVPPAAVPARVDDLRGLPPAFIAVGGVDLFVSEDVTYARRLTESGVPTELLVVPGAFHAFDRVAPETPQGRRFTQAKLSALRSAFANAAS